MTEDDSVSTLFMLDIICNNTPTGVGGQPSSLLPASYALGQNYPNPFNPSTTVHYEVPQATYVKITVYEVLGREVATLVNELKQPGRYEAVFDGRNLASGVYLYRMQAGSFVQTRKLLMIR